LAKVAAECQNATALSAYSKIFKNGFGMKVKEQESLLMMFVMGTPPKESCLSLNWC